MFKILLDTTIIVALITLFGVIISSIIAPLIVERFKAEQSQEEGSNG